MDSTTIALLTGIALAALPAWAVVRYGLGKVRDRREAELDTELACTPDPADPAERLLALEAAADHPPGIPAGDTPVETPVDIIGRRGP